MLGKKVNNVRVVPVTAKILFVFILFVLLSNFTTNYINLVFNRAHLYNQMNQLLMKDLKDLYNYCSNQYEIYQFDNELERSVASIEQKGLHELKNEKAVVLGINPDGTMMFQASKVPKVEAFGNSDTLAKMKDNLTNGKDEGNVRFTFNNEKYFGIYKYNPQWDIFIVRAEEHDEFFRETNSIFRTVSIIIIIITLIIAVVGGYILNYLLRYIGRISKAIRDMIQQQHLTLIPLDGATNDDITYMGTAFNSLSSTVGNLVNIFQKFANQDIVAKAYQERQVKLEGSQKELTILFTDIKSFTFITETLGTDIIKLLNLHYDRAIREIVQLDGVIGSIIGDALLAVFGAIDDTTKNKSYLSVQAAYKIHEVTEALRIRMTGIKDDIERERGKLSPEENKVFKAVLLEVGVGIDGGEVFYGTLGSYVRMTNTVIGDNVNAASRLEGLTRVYKTPVIVSEFVKKDIEDNVPNHGISFIELDTVMVKGKTKGVKVYWPVLDTDLDEHMEKGLSAFEAGLQLYYKGDWTNARKRFARCKLPVADEFKERVKGKCPRGWNGIWEMKTK